MGINIQYGSIGNIQNNLNSNPSSLAYLGSGNFTLTPVRVLDIILDKGDRGFDKYGEWNSIGAIYYELTSTPQSNIPNAEPMDRVAYPLFPNVKQYPLINELTYLITLPGGNLTENPNSLISYYFPPINAWNSQHHNAVPITSTLTPEQTRDYKQVDSGSYRRVTDRSTDIFLGKTFEEKIDIYPLLPYEGDTIYEGRWGNSFRLGSTVKNAKTTNEWSSVGTNGDPIIILRNGQALSPREPWIPRLEEINNDASSIYLTSTQQLPLFPANVNNSSFSKSTPPTNVGQYEGNQIILNSGRLVFNAKSDSMLLLASKAIQLSCGETLGVNAKQISLTADKVYLGSSEGIEGTKIQSVVLGENLNFVLGDIAVFLQTLNIAFQTAIDSNGAPIVSLQSIACDAETLSNDLLNIINAKNLLSKTVKTV